MSTKSCMAILGVMLASTALTIPATASAALKGNLGNIRPLSDWRIGQVKGPTAEAPGYCASVNQFEKGIVLALAHSQDGHLSLAIDFARPHFRAGQTYPVSLKHGDGYTVKAKGLGVNDKSLVIQLGQDPVFLRAMAQEGHLMIGLPDVDMKVSLVTFEKSADKLESCVDNLPRPAKNIQQVQAEPPVEAQEEEVLEQQALSKADPVPEKEVLVTAEAVEKPAPNQAPEPAPTPDQMPKRKAPEWGDITWSNDKEVKEEIVWNKPAPLKEDVPDTVSITANQPSVMPAQAETDFDKVLQKIDRERAEMLAAEDDEISRLVTELDGLVEASAGGQDASQGQEDMARIEALQEKITTLMAEREAERERANQLADKLSDVQAEQKQAVIDNDAARENRIKALDQVEKVDKTRPVMVLQDELLMRQRDLERQARAQAEEAEWLERRRLDVEKRMAEAGKQNPSEKLAQQLKGLKAENRQLKQAYTEAKETIGSLTERSKQEAQIDKQADSLDIPSETAASSDLADKLKAQEDRLSALSNQLDTKEGEISRLQQQADMQQTRDVALQQEAELEAQDLQNREARLETLRKQLNDRENEISRLHDVLEQEKQKESQKLVQQDNNPAIDSDAQLLAEQERQLKGLNNQVERKRTELESLQAALTEQKKLQQEYQAQINGNPYGNKTPDITWNERPTPQLAEKQPEQSIKPVATIPETQENIQPTYVESRPAPRPETTDKVEVPQETAAAPNSEGQKNDNYQRATDLVEELMHKYQPNAGRAATSDRLYLEGRVESVHQPSALSIYKNQNIQSRNTPDSFFVQSIEPAAGSVDKDIKDKTQQVTRSGKHVLMQDVALTRSQMINAGLQQILAKADIQVGEYKDDMRHDGVGYQRNWTTDDLNGQFALYENMSSDRFMTYISNFLNAYTNQNCEGKPVKQLHMVSNDVVTAEISCDGNNVFGGLVFFKDASQGFSVVSHKGALDTAAEIKSINASLSQKLLHNSTRFQNLPDREDLTLDVIFDTPSDTVSEEIQI